MHTFLRAIGFSNIDNRKSLDALLGEVMAHPDKKIRYKVGDSEEVTEITKRFGNSFGVTIRGVYDEKGFLYVEDYFPFLDGEKETLSEQLTFSKKSQDSSYAVMCDDVRLGVLLIFFLVNTIDYIKYINSNGEIIGNNDVYISGLSNEGIILLPAVQGHDCDEKELLEKKCDYYKMVYEARNGNEEALEKLTVNEIDTHMEINNRLAEEDLYSIVNTTFYPYGSESDNYSIIGVIRKYEFAMNEYSKEMICILELDCNDLIFNICINQKDLVGMPMIGARFKGNVWLQGRVEFTE